jgi:hypothetical protein
LPATLARRQEGRDQLSEMPKSNRSQGARAYVRFRALRRRVTVEPIDSHRWRIMLDGRPTDLMVTSSIHDGWALSKTSGEMLARNCRSATEAEDVAAHYLCDSPPG